jgi:multiple sugar transport system substrate-binding protein
MRRWLRIATAALAATLALSACGTGSTTATPGPVKLTYFTFSAAPDHLNDLNTIIGAFNQKYPNITIDVQTASYNDYWTKLQTAIAGGTAPDTFELNYENFVSYSSAGSLLNLSGQASKDSGFQASVYYPRAYSVFQASGKQYGLPETFSDVLLFYNKDLFDAAGVVYPSEEWGWQDELTAAQKLTNASKGVWGDFQPIQFYEFYKVLAQNGGQFLSADKKHATFNDTAGVDAATWLVSKVGKVMPTDAQMGSQNDEALFKAGKLAMWHAGIWEFAAMKSAPFKWDIQLEPGKVTKAHHFFSNAVVASSKTAHPAEAWQWLRFLTSSSNAVKVRLDASWELPAVADQSLFSSYLSQTPPANRAAVFKALDNIVVPPVIEQESQMTDIVSKSLAKAKLGQETVKQALDEAAGKVNALL